MKLIDGKKIADAILLSVRKKIVSTKTRPGLADILVGDDPASKLYVKNKEKACQKVGIEFHKYVCDNNSDPHVSEKKVLEVIHFLNNDQSVHGIIVQLPLPKGIDTEKIISAIDPKKDADGFHPKNYKKYIAGENTLEPPLITSIVKVFSQYNIDLSDKATLIITNSKIFSQGLDVALKNVGANISIVKSDDKTLTEKMKKSDVIISIVGRPHFIKESMIKKDAILIDVGITLVDEKFLGDVDVESVSKKASLVTPTPGGIGPLTVAFLLENTLKLSTRDT